MDALDQRDYERALREFDQYYRTAGDSKEMRGDGALYWKAYTLNKLGRRDESLATLAKLEKTFPTSRWLNDARRCSWKSSRPPDRVPPRKPRPMRI